MTLRRPIIGASLLCALCFCALGAASASATTLHVCSAFENGVTTTAQRYTTSHCEPGTTSVTGAFGTKPIPAVNTKVTTTATKPFKLRGTVAGVAVTLECKKLESPGATATNEEVEGKMRAKGVGKLVYTECIVVAPAEKKCVVKEGKVSTKNIESLSEDIGEVMRVKYTPTEAGIFAEITIEKCTVLALNGTFPVKGADIGFPVQSEGMATSSVVFTEASSKEGGLTFAGNPAFLEGEGHAVMEGTDETLAYETP